jgi:hypothetical protein
MLACVMSGFDGPIHLHMRPSPSLRGGAFVLHLAAIAVLLTYPLTVTSFMLLAALTLDAWNCDRRLARPQPDDIASVLLASNDSWELWTIAGGSCAARLLRASPIHPSMTGLSFACADGKRRHLVLLRDNVDSDAFRRLRVRLGRIVESK